MISVRSASPLRSLALRTLLVVGGSLLMALFAKIAVPLPFGVPITGQTLGLALVVALLGRNAATLAMLTYLAEGLAGLPVFAAGALMSASGGYLLAFPLAAYAIGWLFDRGFAKTYAARFVAIVAGTSLVFAGGVAGLMAVMHLNLATAVAVGVVPFLVGDAIKCALAAALAPQSAKISARLGL